MATCEIRKNKNFLEVWVDNELQGVCFDLNTAEYIGKRGKPVKRFNTEWKNYFYKGEVVNNAYKILLEHIFEHDKLAISPQYRYAYTRYCDMSISLNRECLDIALYTTSCLCPVNSKYLTAFIEEYDNTNALSYSFNELLCFIEYQKWRTTHPTITLSYVWYKAHCISNKINDTEWLEVWQYYYITQKMSQASELSYLVKEYLRYTEEMGVPAVKSKNFCRTYLDTLQSYNRWKEAQELKAFTENYQKHTKAWEFEYGDFKVVIPTSGQDLVREGQLMHHCVGSYISNVVAGDCYICFIRNKSELNKPYITCQIYKNGRVGQYYLSHDRHISLQADIDFKTAFQEYLNQVWRKEGE